MKEIKEIQRLISRVMCVDRLRVIRELRGLQKSLAGKKTPGEDFAGRVERCKKLALESARRRAKRLASIPTISYPPDLPITARKDEIIRAIRDHRVVIISGETGSGKTTQIPKFCLAAGRGGAGKIGCTQPRRVAAVTVSQRIAQEMGVAHGGKVGYKIRFDDRSDRDALIRVMTDGILLAETQKDPYLNEYDTLIVDEAHERSLNIDFTLGILRNLLRKRRDLKLIITSATIDTEKFSKAFDDAPVVEVSGRMFPVEVRYSPLEEDGDDQGYVEAAVAAVDHILRETRFGDILVFMPTEQDIGEALEMIRGRGYPGVVTLPLFARLSAPEQARVFARGAGRKVIVSTNVAETSLTIPGITHVVDSGLARIPYYSPRTRTTGLPVRAISQSSADQRKGRCGRVSNGICIRLYSEEDYNSRPFFTSPEILRSNLAEVVLRMISLGLGDVSAFPFIDSPSPKSIKDGFDTLLELGAIKVVKKKKGKKGTKGGNDIRLTPRGRIMARIPVDPKLARILMEARERGCLDEAVIIVSALAVSDPRNRPKEMLQQADQKHAVFKDSSSDFVTLLNIWKSFRDAEKRLKSRGRVRRFCQDNFLSFKRLREWSDIHRQLRSVLKEHGINARGGTPLTSGTKGLKSKEFEMGGPLYIALHKSILAGYLANIARKKDKNLFNAAKGQQAMIFPGSGLFNKAGSWIVAAEYVETTRLFARKAACIDPDWLEELGGELCTRTWSSPHWEKKRGEVVALEQVSLFGLIIVPERSVSYGKINPEEAGEIFIRQALVEGEVGRPFPFMEHNRALIEKLGEVEEKTRTRGILADEEDIFEYYHKRLPTHFFNIRTFARFLKERGDDRFLRMTPRDLIRQETDTETLKQYPDTLEMGGGNFELAYGFDPGSDRDGVTLKVPAVTAGAVRPEKVERLVPGLFEEKIVALIRNLPKEFRVRLMPASEKAKIIAKEMAPSHRPLFSDLSRFIQERFRVRIPASAWSEKGLDDHLKMRIAVVDKEGREIKASRDRSVLDDFTGKRHSGGHAFEEIRARLERENLTCWDVGDLEDSISIDEGKGISFDAFLGLQREKDGSVSLRLFRSRDGAEKAHLEGVRALYEIYYAKDFKALKKDLKSSPDLKATAPLFGGGALFYSRLYDCITRELFGVNIRTREAFDLHAEKMIPSLYVKGRAFGRMIADLGRAWGKTRDVLGQIGLKNLSRVQVAALVRSLEGHLKSLVPDNFPEIYEPARIKDLKRYVEAIRIRCERGAVDPVKDGDKSRRVAVYEARLQEMTAGLSGSSSREKVQAVETFFWMVEEFKVSLFAQELRAGIKISPKRLDDFASRIDAMI